MSRRALGDKRTVDRSSGDGLRSDWGTGKSVQCQRTAVIPPVRKRTNTHGVCSRQNTRLTRPDCPR